MDRALQRRLDSLGGRVQKLSELLGNGEEDEGEDGEARDFALPVKAFFENEKALLQTLLGRLRGLAKDSKWEQCAALLRQLDQAEPGAKVLMFTQYRATQVMLRERLVKLFPNVPVEIVHGDVEAADRRAARIRFENESRFLVSTEAGGEGVNLQKACHVMVNYDLPWNPMRLQQRIGRLDRYGQQRVVQVFMGPYFLLAREQPPVRITFHDHSSLYRLWRLILVRFEGGLFGQQELFVSHA